ncbi:Major facilitator superfamily domain [Phytophthora cactorum]|nr:Major facilitator superfamily domain [Phytophthora cactorum]
MKACQIQSQGLIVLLCLVNLLNYIDRGIIPGAPQSFRHFITSSLGVAVTDQSVYFGLLSSSFIIGHSVLSIVFGYFAQTHRPFQIVSLGTSIWIVAIIICAISEHVNSYALLIVGRVLSGVGEASFQCVAPPFIDRHAPPTRRRSTWGSTWRRSSWAPPSDSCLLMACLVFCCLFCVPDELNVVPPTDDEAALRKPLVSTNEFASEVMSLSRESHDTVERNATELSPAEYGEKFGVEMTPAEISKSFLETWWEILSDVPFLLVVLAHGSYTFTLGVFNAFGPDVFIGLGLFSDETSASLIFGGIVAVTSLIGTPLGGFVLDRYTKHTTVPGKRCFVAVSSLFFYVSIAEVFALIMCFISDSKGAFLTCFTIALFCMCALWGPEMVAVLELFPSSRRSMAISTNAVIIHVFGDVPAPIVMGIVRDKWAPNCGTVEDDGDAVLNPLCSEDQDGLKNFMLLSVLWMVWAVILWALAMVAIKRRQRNGGFVLTAPAEI